MPCLVSLSHHSVSPNLFQKTNPQRRKFCRRNHGRIVTALPNMSISSSSHEPGRCSLSRISPLETVLFDIDGTICDSDPLHYFAFREMLQEVGFNGGIPITEEFFVENISGKHNEYICETLCPGWDLQRSLKFMDDKEAMFRRLASEQLKPINGLHKLCKWIEDRGLKRAAVTNAPRKNAELMISIMGLTNFFELLVIGGECEQAKPFPDPYLKALQALGASPDHTFVFEDSASGIKAGVAAGMPVVGLTVRNPEQLLMEAGGTLLIKDFDDPKLWAALEELDRLAAQTKVSA
ncbi:haloacid dehalogenase-like hydrolase domain-containing protein Sgpp [Tasmannia lanceolata]|uniref:haloacid dehalogenase-like hydrolase domain-containing protein Sgpp n=1 Tax=Tasmannia lanceolata TaxID=3420 RepID=UPI00406344FF